MAENLTSSLPFDWQCPPAALADNKRLGWLDEAVEQGQAWLKNQRGYRDMRKALDTLSGRDASRLDNSSYRSQLNSNPLKRDIREVVGVMAKLRPFWGYHSDNHAYDASAEMMNKVTRAIYLEQFFDVSIKDALRYASATARGWVRPVYRRKMYGTGRGDLALLTYGAPCVLPVQLPGSGNWQEAYAVTILDEMPVAMAHGMWPDKQAVIKPKNSRYWYSDDTVRKAAGGNWIRRAFGQVNRTADAPALADLLVPIRYTYVIDLSVNTTKAEIPMGEPGSSWSYNVPYVGQDIPVGTDPRSGQPLFRKADANDARLYPYRRLLISTDSAMLYDGPSFDWHGMFPAVSFTMDAWPWEPLGFSLVHDGYEINEAIKEIERGNMDKVRAGLNPSLAYDSNAVASKEAREFDPMMPRGRCGFDGAAVEATPFRTVLDKEFYAVDPNVMAFREALMDALHGQLAVKDVMALAKMRAAGSMDDLEKIVEAQGPIVEDMSRSMEPPMRDLGDMVKYLVLQYYNVPRIMQYVGADGVTPEIFDYDPSSLVPSHLPGENPGTADAPAPSAYTRLQRARNLADNLRFYILPNSLHEMQQMTMKLGLIQLRKAGVMIDSQTIAEAWGIANYGTLDGNTVLERWRNEQELQLEMAARMKELAGAAGLTPPGAANPAAGKPNPEGRPTSGAAAPRLVSKEGGARSTIAESK